MIMQFIVNCYVHSLYVFGNWLEKYYNTLCRLMDQEPLYKNDEWRGAHLLEQYYTV